jgi:hypothetical protein
MGSINKIIYLVFLRRIKILNFIYSVINYILIDAYTGMPPACLNMSVYMSCASAIACILNP